MEVLIALAVLGTAMTVLLMAHNSTLNLVASTQDDVTVRMLLQRALGEAELEAMAGNDAGEKDFGKRYEGWSYTFEATPILGEELPEYRNLAVTVVDPAGTEWRYNLFVYGSASAWSDENTGTNR